ncbi:MAG: protein kinase [Acidobacteria bacterium]|nr:protein kinase [Acidobacteriota bacterium]
MTLQSGLRLGPYEIVAPIGTGGMGEVYKAEDTRLGRPVAVKVLPAEFAEDIHLRARLDREARVVATLNHPHICVLHDVGEATARSGTRKDPSAQESRFTYLVMEYCEGETLAERLERGPLPHDQLLGYGIEISEALAMAHRSGIIHRDLKPSNIMLTRSGAKLLDFGLARPLLDLVEGDSTTTIRLDPTEEGRFAGTLRYMAPEVLSGKKADSRSDIFALGLVLYEMAGGRPAFTGESKADIVASILRDSPRPLREIDCTVRPALQYLVDRCLAKDPEARWESAHDLAEQLRWIRESATEPENAVRSWPRWRFVAITALVVAAVAMAAAWALASRQARVDDRSVVRLSVPLTGSEGVGLGHGTPTVAVSPNSDSIIYSRVEQGAPGFYVRRLDEFHAGTRIENGWMPFFSPDGRSIGFFSGRDIKRVSAGGGVPRTLATGVGGAGRGATWSRDGFIYYSRSSSGGIWRVPADGGRPEEITVPDSSAGENSHRWPHALPDGESLLFTIRTEQMTSFDEARIAVLSLKTRQWRVIWEGGSCARYVDGYLFFGRDADIYTLPLDERRWAVAGKPRKVLEGVVWSPSSGAAHFDVTDRALVYLPGTGSRSTSLLVADRTGRTETLAKLDFDMVYATVAPSQERIALTVGAANDDIWTYDLPTGVATRLSFEPGDEVYPVWSHDETEVIYFSGQLKSIVAAPVDGAAPSRRLIASPGRPVSVSPDGSVLAFSRQAPETGHDIWFLPLTGNGVPRPVVRTPHNEFMPSISPDGKWLAYYSDHDKGTEVQIQSLESGKRWQVSAEGVGTFWGRLWGGRPPRWSADGTEVYYWRGNDLYFVEMERRGESLKPATPRLLFTIEGIRSFDVFGDRFLLVKSNEEVGPVNVVLNWSEELDD